MLVLKGCKHNHNVSTILRNGAPYCVDMECHASSGIYPMGTHRFIDLDVHEFIEEVQALERFVTESCNPKSLVFATDARTRVLQRVKIPCRYGHVIVPLTNHQGSKITTYDVQPGMRLAVCLQGKSVWCTASDCGIAWVVHSIKTLHS